MKFIILLLLINSVSYAGQVSTNWLTAKYPTVAIIHLNEGTGTSVKVEKATYANGTITGALSWNPISPGTTLFNSGLWNDGTATRYVAFTGISATAHDAVSFSAWFYVPTVPVNGQLIGTDKETAEVTCGLHMNYLMIYYTAGGEARCTALQGTSCAGTNSYIPFPVPRRRGVGWMHCAVTFSANTHKMKVYQDGIYGGEGASAEVSAVSPTGLLIMRYSNGGNYTSSIPGGVDDVLYLEHAEFSKADIARIYQEGVGRHSNAR